MAVDIVASFAQPIIDYAIRPIRRQFGYLFHYTRNIDALKEEVHKLEIEQVVVQRRVDAAQRNLEVTLPNVEEWLAKVNQVKEDTGLFLQNDVKENQRCFKWLMCPDLLSRYRVSRRASKKAIDIAAVSNNGKSFDLVSTPAVPPPAEAKFGDQIEDFGSRRSAFNRIMEALGDDKVSIIGVYGMGGIGKTTLAKQIAKEAEKRNIFAETAMATVSQTLEVSKIQGDIAEHLGLKLEEENIDVRAAKLSQRFLQSRGGVLVILDDLWDALEPNKIGLLPTQQCKLIITSRDRNVCSMMNSDKEFKLEILSQVEGLHLFQKEIGAAIDSQGLHCMAEEIVAKCQGLPLAIKAIAKALKGRSRNSWEVALTHIRKSNPEKIQGMTKDVYMVLECSFTFLNSEEQQCFLICRFFKEDAVIRFEDVRRYCVGLRIFGDVDSLEEARMTTRALLEKLKDRCLLLGDERGDSIGMHDVIRDFARLVASTGKHGYKFLFKDGESVNMWPDISTMTDCTAISLRNNSLHGLPERVDCPKLEVLKLENGNIPNDFFVNMTELKVLVIIGNMPSLPQSISFLTKLKMLYVQSVNPYVNLTWSISFSGGSISFIGELRDLRVLRISCDMKELPKEFGQLTQLMILDLSDCHYLRVIPLNLLPKLTKLECLHMCNGFDQWGKGNNATLEELKYLSCLKTLEIHVEELSQFPKDDDLHFEKLMMFHISISWIKPDPQLFTNEKVLYMKGACLEEGSDFPAGVKTLVKNAQSLYVFRCRKVLNYVLDTLKRHRFANLRHFEVYEEWGPEKRNEEEEGIELGLWECSELQELVLRNVTGLTNLWKECTSYAFLGNLKEVVVDGCPRLKSLFPRHVCKHLRQLEKLKVFHCKSIEEIFAEDDDEDGMVLPKLKELKLHDLPNSPISFCRNNRRRNSISSLPLFDGQVNLPALERLWIHKLPMIEELCSDQHSAESFCELKTLKVDYCEKMVKLIPSNILPRLKNLKELEIIGCKSVEPAEIERLIGVHGCPANSSTTSESLSLSLGNLPQLTEMWWNKDGNETFSFRYSIGTLEVDSCNGLRNLFVPSAINKHFNHLKQLKIVSCENLEEVVAAAVTEQGGSSVKFPCVTSLKLSNLPKLRRFCSSGNHTLTWPSLKDVFLWDCPNMKVFCAGTLVTPVLEDIEIDRTKQIESDLNKAIQYDFDRRRKGNTILEDEEDEEDE